MGDRGSGPPPEKSQEYRVSITNTGRDRLKNYKATKPAFKVRETPFSLRPIMARFSAIWILSPYQLKNNVRVGPPLTKLSGSVHAIVIEGSVLKELMYFFCIWTFLFCFRVEASYHSKIVIKSSTISFFLIKK